MNIRDGCRLDYQTGSILLSLALAELDYYDTAETLQK